MGKASRAKKLRRETGKDPRRARDPLLVKGYRDVTAKGSKQRRARDAKAIPPRWLGELCSARRCIAVIADNDGPAEKLSGRERRAVEVVLPLGHPGFRDFRVEPGELRGRGSNGELVAAATEWEGWADTEPVRVFYLDDEELAEGDRSPNDELAQRMVQAGAELGVELERQWGYPGWAWQKVTAGRGATAYAHLTLPVAHVVAYIDAASSDTAMSSVIVHEEA